MGRWSMVKDISHVEYEQRFAQYLKDQGPSNAGGMFSYMSWAYLSPCLSPLRSNAIACDMRANRELVDDAGLPRRSVA